MKITPAMVAGARTLAEPRLSPDGSRLGYLVRDGETKQLVGAGDAPQGAPMSHPSGGGAWAWRPGGAGVVLADGGAWSPAVAPDGRVVTVVDDRRVEVDGRDLAASPEFAFDPDWSPDGTWVAWHEWDAPHMPWQESRIVRRRADAGAPVEVVAGHPGVGVSQPRWSPAGDRIAWISDATGWRNVWVAEGDGSSAHPVVEERHEHGGPTWGPGQRTYAWSPDGERVAFCRNEDGFGRLCIAPVGGGEVLELGRGWHWALSWQGARLAALRGGARTPTELVVYDVETGERSRVDRGPDDAWDGVDLVEPEIVRWTSTDGVTVAGRLYRPPGARGPSPLLAWVHGGPTDQLEVGFNPRIAYFVERGWAVLAPDHRGTSGLGRAWEDALLGRWGDVDVADTAAGMRAAAAAGWAQPSRMVAIGGSAGGATALRVAARHPDLCAGAVTLYPVADLAAPTPSRFEAHYGNWLVGEHPWPVERLDRPVLVLHGYDDDVVPVDQSLALARRFPERVTLHVYEGEGHGWKQPGTTVDELVRTEEFLARL